MCRRRSENLQTVVLVMGSATLKAMSSVPAKGLARRAVTEMRQVSERGWATATPQGMTMG